MAAVLGQYCQQCMHTWSLEAPQQLVHDYHHALCSLVDWCRSAAAATAYRGLLSCSQQLCRTPAWSTQWTRCSQSCQLRCGSSRGLHVCRYQQQPLAAWPRPRLAPASGAQRVVLAMCSQQGRFTTHCLHPQCGVQRLTRCSTVSNPTSSYWQSQQHN